jgi:hypothetical protein
MPSRNQTRFETPMSTMNPGELDVDDARVAELVVGAGIGQPTEHRGTEVEVVFGYRVVHVVVITVSVVVGAGVVGLAVLDGSGPLLGAPSPGDGVHGVELGLSTVASGDQG